MDWFWQAEKDLGHAVHAMETADHEWACFAAQQAAEKALKAVYIPTRYPNCFDAGAPGQFFVRSDAEEAIAFARTIIEFCRQALG